MLKVFQATVGTSNDTDGVQETLTSIQRLIALSGLSWDYKQSKSAKRCTASVVASRIYSSVVCVIYVLFCVEMTRSYSKAESLTETSLTIANQTVTMLSLAYWCLSTSIHNKVRIFCERLRETRLKFNSCVSNTKLRQRVKRACLCIVIFAALICVASVLSISMMDGTFNEFSWSNVILSSIRGGYVTLLNNSLLLLFLSISLLLTYEYDSCAMRLLRASEGSVKEEDIEDIRGYHASLTDIVEHVSSLMSRHVAAGYVSSFLSVCFCLYSVINDDTSFLKMSIAAYAVCSSIQHLIALTYIGIRLHEAAYRPLNILHDLAGRNMPDRIIGLVEGPVPQGDRSATTVVTLFANKLSQRQIGISALGLMTITKDTILTIIGTLLTYVFIVIQFKPESTSECRKDANTTAI